MQDEPCTRLRYFCSPYHQESPLYPIIAHLERTAGFTRNDTALNNWNHLVVNVARSGNLSLYLNGLLQSGAVDISGWNGVDLTASPAVPLNLGRNVNVGQYWPGKIGAVRVYQRVLTQAEITTLSQNP